MEIINICYDTENENGMSRKIITLSGSKYNSIFQLNFKHLNTLPEIVSVKNGARSADNEVEAITGATISSKAVVKLLNISLDDWRKPINQFMDDQGDQINKQAK